MIDYNIWCPSKTHKKLFKDNQERLFTKIDKAIIKSHLSKTQLQILAKHIKVDIDADMTSTELRHAIIKKLKKNL